MGSVLTEVTINSTDVSSRVRSWEVTETYGQDIKSCKIVFPYSIYSTLSSLSVGQTITVKRGTSTATDYFEFDGNVTEIKKDGAQVTVYGGDKLLNLVNSSINTSYDKDVDTQAGVGSEIFMDMVNTYSDLSADSTSVESTGTTLLITQFRCKNTNVYERSKVLAEIYDYQEYWDADNQLVVFEPKGFVDSGVTLTVGDNVSEVPEWVYDTSQMVNSIDVQGASQLVENTQSFTGDGTTDTFTIAQEPQTVRVEVNGTLQTGGVEGSTSSFDYSVDKVNKEIVFETASIPGAAASIEITYSYYIDITPNIRNETSITQYGTKHTTMRFSDIETVDDAIERGQSFVDKYSEPFISTKLKVRDITLALRAGYTVTVVDDYNNENRVLVINKIVKKWPHSYDEIYVGDEEYRTTEFDSSVLDRLKRLEEELAGNTDLLINVRQPEESVVGQERYLMVQTLDTSSDTLWDVALWDTGVWEGSYDSSAVTARVLHPANHYEEEFYDTDFKDTTYTTATWDTTNERIDFTSGQIAQSGSIHLNNGTVTQATLTVTYTGTLTLEMTADGSNWETVASATQHSFTNTGQDLRWRATSTGTSQLTALEVDYIV